MLNYIFGFLIYAIVGYAVSVLLLRVYEWNRAYKREPLEEHAKWHVRRAIAKTSVGAGFVAGVIWILVRSTPF